MGLCTKEEVHMDMSSAKKAADKLLEYVQSVATSDSKLYGKSKQRLQSIGNVCSEIVSAVSVILQNEVLQSEQHEVESRPGQDIYAQVAALSAEIDRLREFVQIPDDFHKNHQEIQATPQVEECTDDCEELQSNDAEIPQDSEKLSPDEMREIVHKYGVVLENAAHQDCGLSAGNQLTYMLWKWFEARIFTRYDNAPPFHYGVHRLKNIIYAFVIAYGKHFEEGTVDTFFRYFEDWLASLKVSHDSNKWIAPYEVYTIERSLDADTANITSVVLWDILTDSVLKSLVVPQKGTYYLHDSDVWDKVFEADPSCLDSYVNYKHDSSLLESLKLM